MRSIRIAIDPQLTERQGPEVHWAWRLILSSLGFAWDETRPGEPCDLAHVTSPARAPLARVCVLADPAAWSAPGERRLARVSSNGFWPQVYYAGDAQRAELVPIGGEPGRLWLPRDVVFDLFWLATGQEERIWPQAAHGFFDVTWTAAGSELLFTTAPASATIVALGRALAEIGLPPPGPAWPGGAAAAAAITHDVDYTEVVRWLEPARIVARLGVRGIGPAWSVATGRRNHWHFADWQSLERQYGVHSAFYFVARQGSLIQYAAGRPDPFYDVMLSRFRSTIRALAEAGCEIGMQASYLAFQSAGRLAAEKERVEEACGRPVSGNRHHYWHVNPADSEETLLMHEQVGLAYDTSLAHDRYLGWRRGLAVPFFPFHQAQRRELRTLQLPPAWMDAQLFKPKPLGPEARRAALSMLVDRVVEHRGILVVGIHDYVFDEALFPGWQQALRELLDRIRERGDFWVATPEEIARHWSSRYSTLSEASQGLLEGRP